MICRENILFLHKEHQMHLVKSEYETKDRWILKITRLEPGQTKKFNPQGTDYVMLAGASIQSKKFDVKNVTAACTITEPYKISCGEDSYAAVVSYTGLALLENTITIIDPANHGNLSYINNASNTNAINPSRDGDPCINYDYFPTNMVQTPHIHPSHRIGLIIAGEGCIELLDKVIDVKKGDLFFLPRMELHHFLTKDKTVVLWSFSPDSETGPTDQSNPVKARTYLDNSGKLK